MYRQVARGDDADLHFEVGRRLAEHLGYPARCWTRSQRRRWRRSLASAITSTSPGCGPARGARPGLWVGHRRLLRGRAGGRAGRVVGVDMTDEQLPRPERCGPHGYSQVELMEAHIEELR